MLEAKTATGRRIRKDCEDLTGKTFHYWTVLGLVPRDGGRIKWLIQCVCGKQRKLGTYSLKNDSKSCGCKRTYAPRKNARPKPVERPDKPEFKAQKASENETPEERNYRVTADTLRGAVRSGAKFKELLELAGLPEDTSKTVILLIYPNIGS